MEKIVLITWRTECTFALVTTQVQNSYKHYKHFTLTFCFILDKNEDSRETYDVRKVLIIWKSPFSHFYWLFYEKQGNLTLEKKTLSVNI